MRRVRVAILAVLVITSLTLPAAGIAVAGTSARAATTAPSVHHGALSVGARGRSVTDLQHRLAQLRYYPGAINGVFGDDTLEAVWAFQETQGLPGENLVTAAFWRALAHPRAPRVLVPNGGSFRIEINLGAEVLVLYKNNQPELISHVSTGGGYLYNCTSAGCARAVTPTGNFRTLSYLPGWVQVPLGFMFNPVFFIGSAFAIHGDIPVPLPPVSHGCVRIPMDIAAFFHNLIKVPGTPVFIRR